MKKIGMTLILSSVLLVGMASSALGAIKIDSSRFFVGPSAAIASAPDSDARIRALNQKLYPDDAKAIDWLCDGVAPCIALS